MSESLCGVIIGALAAIVGGLIGELYKYHLENKRFRKEQRKQAYESIERCLIQSTAHYRFVSGEEYRKTIEEMGMSVSLYASAAVRTHFEQISDLVVKENKSPSELIAIENMSKELEALMRKDLGIKD